MSGVRLVEAYSQVSRFHAETLSTSYDVDLKQVNVAVGQLDLLVDARLQLLYGRHYAMIGRNGSGKTTLLNAIARGELVGWPPHVKVSLVSQELAGREDQSVLQAVLESVAELLQLRRLVGGLFFVVVFLFAVVVQHLRASHNTSTPQQKTTQKHTKNQ